MNYLLGDNDAQLFEMDGHRLRGPDSVGGHREFDFRIRYPPPSVSPAVATATPTPLREWCDLKQAAADIGFEDIARYPDRHDRALWHSRARIIQSLQDGDDFTFRLQVTQGEYGWDDVVLAIFDGDKSEFIFLEDDVVELVAELRGQRTYEAVLGNAVTLPFMRIVEMHLDGEAPAC